jgi:N-acetylneuraminate synthase
MAANTIHLGDKKVGDNEPIYLIAEIGINHNGSIDIAKKLIDASFATGWDCAKFQRRDPDLSTPEKQKSVMRDTPWGKMTYLEYKKRIEFGEEVYKYIDRYCKEKPISWSASAWDIPSLQFLIDMKVPYIKIASAKITDLELVEAAAKSGIPVIASTGMSTLEEVDTMVDILKLHTDQYILMHTNSTYPTPEEDVNLGMIKTLKDRYGCLVGYSGHEMGLEPTVAATALGACIVERHVTLDHDMWGSDHFASLEVQAMAILEKRVRTVEKALGDGIKVVSDQEKVIRKKLRG